MFAGSLADGGDGRLDRRAQPAWRRSSSRPTTPGAADAGLAGRQRRRGARRWRAGIGRVEARRGAHPGPPIRRRGAPLHPQPERRHRPPGRRGRGRARPAGRRPRARRRGARRRRGRRARAASRTRWATSVPTPLAGWSRPQPAGVLLRRACTPASRSSTSRCGVRRQCSTATVPEHQPAAVDRHRRRRRGRTFLDRAIAAGHEGVMVKDLDAPYDAGRRGERVAQGQAGAHPRPGGDRRRVGPRPPPGLAVEPAPRRPRRATASG